LVKILLLFTLHQKNHQWLMLEQVLMVVNLYCSC
uniref:Transposase n=1 Tax=Strongyloides papillosus TaxID=174720 RepID=A0A0N5BJJ9_STREA